MDFNKVKGYEKLDPGIQKIFENTYKNHQATLGAEAKKDFTPVRVKIEYGYLKVTFANRDWLHYTPKGEWY